jgi:hypothetical protein
MTVSAHRVADASAIRFDGRAAAALSAALLAFAATAFAPPVLNDGDPPSRMSRPFIDSRMELYGDEALKNSASPFVRSGLRSMRHCGATTFARASLHRHRRSSPNSMPGQMA